MSRDSAADPRVSAWRFRPSPIDGGRTGDDQAAMNFAHDLETFACEMLQNSLEARLPTDIFGSPRTEDHR